jgi:soluble lytic murein transglycosylase
MLRTMITLHDSARRTIRWPRILIAAVIVGSVLLFWVWPKLIERYPFLRLRFWRDETRYDEIIWGAAGRHNISPHLVKAVIKQESDFVAHCVGAAGERGLMQITPGAVKDWERNTGNSCPHPGLLFNPALNIEIGTWYLARALKRWQKYADAEVLALAEYNAGPSRAKAWAPATPEGNALSGVSFPGTRHYISSILDYKNDYTSRQQR